MHKLIIILSFSLICFQVWAQCPVDSVEIEVFILPDDYPGETSWDLWDNNGNLLAEGDEIGTSLCVDLNSCLIFTIYDSYGDGICCEYGSGSYSLTDASGNTLASGGSFGTSEVKNFSVGSE